MTKAGKAIYLDPSKKASVTFLKIPRKLKKKMKKDGRWGMPIIKLNGKVLKVYEIPDGKIPNDTSEILIEKLEEYWKGLVEVPDYYDENFLKRYKKQEARE